MKAYIVDTKKEIVLIGCRNYYLKENRETMVSNIRKAGCELKKVPFVEVEQNNIENARKAFEEYINN